MRDGDSEVGLGRDGVRQSKNEQGATLYNMPKILAYRLPRPLQ